MYIDDIIITSSSTAKTQDLIHELGSAFAIKDLGDLHYFLGIEVSHLPTGLHLSQAKYVQDLLSRLQLDAIKPLIKPATAPKLSKFNGRPMMDLILYRTTVGALQYLTLT